MKRVLITEDDGLIAEIYRDSFEREGFSAEVASDGAIAIQRLKGNPPDVVVLDLMMPNVNGLDVLKHIRSESKLKSLPVIVMSNAFASAVGREAAAAGATKMFAKNGCSPKRLVKEVRDLLTANASEAADLAGDTAVIFKNLRKEVGGVMPQRMAALKGLIEAWGVEGAPGPQSLLEIHKSVHQVAGMVSLAGFHGMAQLACALEALVKELHSKPQKINPSSRRTVAEAAETLRLLSTLAVQHLEETIPSPLILVVDDDSISRETTCMALEQAHLRALALDDPLLALKLAGENRFDLILSDVQMPQMNGVDLCKKIHATTTNAKTPVIFVTSLNEFESQVRAGSGHGMDFIAKPIMLVELAVKALTLLLNRTARA